MQTLRENVQITILIIAQREATGRVSIIAAFLNM